MEISVAGQAAALTGAIALGLGVGLLYDLLRLLRCRLRLPLLGPALDLLFWAAVTIALFLYVIAATGGRGAHLRPAGPVRRRGALFPDSERLDPLSGQSSGRRSGPFGPADFASLPPAGPDFEKI